MYLEVYDISFDFTSFFLHFACINIIFNTKNLFLISALLSLPLTAVLWAISNISQECFRKHHCSHLAEKEMLVNKMRLRCMEKEKLYLDKGETAHAE